MVIKYKNMDNQQLDQDVVNLAKAIRQHETGNRAVKGASGEMASRYQYLPSTWKSTAKKYLGDENAPVTLENENKATYLKIKDWKNSGYNPAQIASMWNSGKPEWEGKVGVNKYGVKYDVPKYVNNVYKNYQKFKSENQYTNGSMTQETQSITTEQPKEEKSFLQKAGGFIGDLLGGTKVGEALGNVIGGKMAQEGEAGQTIQSTILNIESQYKQGKINQKLRDKLLNDQEQVAKEAFGYNGPSFTQIAGDVAQIGLTFAGGALEKAGAKVAVSVLTKTPILNKVAGITSKVVGGAGLGYGYDVATGFKEGETLQEAIKPSVGTAVGAGMPLAGGIIKGVSRGIFKGLGEAIGKTTGVGYEAVKEAVNNPNVIKFAREVGINGSEDMTTSAMESVAKGFASMAEKRSSAYRTSLQKILLRGETSSKIANNITDEAINLTKGTRDGGYNILMNVDDAGTVSFDFGKSTIVEGQNAVTKALKTVLENTDNSVDNLDIIKKQLYDYKTQVPKGSPADSLISKLGSKVGKELKDNVKGYAEMSSKYEEAKNLSDEIYSALSLGSKNTETQAKKIMSVLRQNNEMRKELLQVLAEESGDDIIGKVAGTQLAPAMPRGIAGTLVGAGTGMLAIQSIPAYLVYLATSSPRLMAEFLNLIGMGVRVGDKLQFSPEVQKKIMQLFTAGMAEKKSKEKKKDDNKIMIKKIGK